MAAWCAGWLASMHHGLSQCETIHVWRRAFDRSAAERNSGKTER